MLSIGVGRRMRAKAAVGRRKVRKGQEKEVRLEKKKAQTDSIPKERGGRVETVRGLMHAG